MENVYEQNIIQQISEFVKSNGDRMIFSGLLDKIGKTVEHVKHDVELFKTQTLANWTASQNVFHRKSNITFAEVHAK